MGLFKPREKTLIPPVRKEQDPLTGRTSPNPYAGRISPNPYAAERRSPNPSTYPLPSPGAPPPYSRNAAHYNDAARNEYNSRRSEKSAENDDEDAQLPAARSRRLLKKQNSDPPPLDEQRPRQERAYVDTKTTRRTAGDPYSHDETQDLESDRRALFSGYKPQEGARNRFRDGPAWADGANEEEEEDVEAIKTKTRFLKQDTVEASRNALRLALQAEETARATLLKLGDQSDLLADSSRIAATAKINALNVDDKARDIKMLNRSILVPAVTFNRDKKIEAQKKKAKDRYEEDMKERSMILAEAGDSRRRVQEGLGAGGKSKNAKDLEDRRQQRKRYQFEATPSDDELEEELDDNLDQLEKATFSIKSVAASMGEELDKQNHRIKGLDRKTADLDFQLSSTTNRLNLLAK